MDRTGRAVWEGGLKAGKGQVSLGSGAFSGPYSFATRFGDTPGTNPEELIGAAHAACFSMAFASGLEKAGHPPSKVETSAVVHLGKGDAGYSITGIDLNCHVEAGDIAADLLQATADDAKKNCPVSRALAAVPINLKLV